MKATWLIAAAVVLAAGFAGAESGGRYRVVWSTIDGGGGTISGGAYTITNTIGQPDAGSAAGGGYEALGGFWVGGPVCVVRLEDFARFAGYWLEWPCGTDNDWCGGADLDKSGGVGIDDFATFCDYWLKRCPYAWPLK